MLQTDRITTPKTAHAYARAVKTVDNKLKSQWKAVNSSCWYVIRDQESSLNKLSFPFTCHIPPSSYRPSTTCGISRSGWNSQQSEDGSWAPTSASGLDSASNSNASGLDVLPSRPSDRNCRSCKNNGHQLTTANSNSFCNCTSDTSLPSARQHLSYGDCLEVKPEYYQNCFPLDCVTQWQCSQSAAHLYNSSSYRSNRLGLSHSDPDNSRQPPLCTA